MSNSRQRTSLALLLLALAAALCGLVACSTSTATPYTALPAGVNPTLRGTVDAAYVDAAATQIWLDADATVAGREAEKHAVATQIAGRLTATAAASEAALRAQETAVMAGYIRETAAAADKTATATAQSATQIAVERLTGTAAANANATAAVAAVLDATARALSGHQTAVAQSIADAAATREVERINLEARRQRDTAAMYTVLTWAAGVGGLGVVGLLVFLGYRAFQTWDHRRHFLDQGNGESVMWDEVEEQLPSGRRVRRRVLVNPSRAVGPVLDVAIPSPLPAPGDQARVAGQAQFTRGWIESARASARAIEASIQAAGAPKQLRAPAAVAAGPSAQIPAGAQGVFLPPLQNESERLTHVMVIDGAADAQAAIAPRLLTAIERDWSAAEGESDGND